MIHRISVDAIDEGSTESWRVHVFTGAPSKRQDTAALHNVAVISSLIFACVVECGGAPPLFDAANKTRRTCQGLISTNGFAVAFNVHFTIRWSRSTNPEKRRFDLPFLLDQFLSPFDSVLNA